MAKTIVILTGAGISAESGIQTFRGDGGLWEGHRVEDVATPEGFARNPELVQRFYNERRRKLLSGIEPNEGHRALARLEEEFEGEVVLITQNIDNLHERGGSREVLHMHGELLRARCVDCGEDFEILEDLGKETECPLCEGKGTSRPDIVWFGEMPYHMGRIEKSLSRADVFVAIGTSGRVYPAAGFCDLARYAGAETIEVNLEATEGTAGFLRVLEGKAGELLPELVDELLGKRP
ncbi:MAG: NAD-dependent deacylase [Verrucomicrobiaceae bacterium]